MRELAEYFINSKHLVLNGLQFTIQKVEDLLRPWPSEFEMHQKSRLLRGLVVCDDDISYYKYFAFAYDPEVLDSAEIEKLYLLIVEKIIEDTKEYAKGRRA